MLFSVITSTYNRGYIIENLYQSLKRQKTNNFEWIVIDDGSDDDTGLLFEKWMKEDNMFLIRYYKQANQGLIYSLNKAINLAKGDYIIKVDSDDYLTDDCLAFFESEIQCVNGKLYGISGMRGIDLNTPIKGWPTIDKNIGWVDASDLERKKYNLDADMCEAWKKEVLVKYPFQLWPGEKFAPEQITLNQIALEGYKIRWYSKIICICNYRNDGLTKGVSKLIKDNPMGYAMMYNHMLNYDISIKEKLYAALQCDIQSILGHNLRYINKNGHIFLKYITFPLSLLWSIRRKIQYKK